MIHTLGRLTFAIIQQHPVWTGIIILSSGWVFDSVLQTFALSQKTSKSSTGDERV